MNTFKPGQWVYSKFFHDFGIVMADMNHGFYMVQIKNHLWKITEKDLTDGSEFAGDGKVVYVDFKSRTRRPQAPGPASA